MTVRSNAIERVHQLAHGAANAAQTTGEAHSANVARIDGLFARFADALEVLTTRGMWEADVRRADRAMIEAQTLRVATLEQRARAPWWRRVARSAH